MNLICGAMTTKKTPCQKPAMPNGRCRIHGGLSKGPLDPGLLKGNRNALRHGVYAEGLLPGEDLSKVDVGKLDDEIRLLRIRLRRVLKAQSDWESQRARLSEALDALVAKRDVMVSPDVLRELALQAVEQMEINDRHGCQRRTRYIWRSHDFLADMLRIVRLIGILEHTRSVLLTNNGGGGSEDLASRLQAKEREHGE